MNFKRSWTIPFIWLLSSVALLAPASVLAVKPVITSASSTAFTAGAPGTFTVTVTSTPTAKITRKGGSLPSGVTFVDNGNNTATLAGTPAATAGGTYTFRIRASNPQKDTQTFTLTVRQDPVITSANSTTCAIGVACTFTVTTTGFPVPSVVRTGAALPAGMSFVNNGNGTGTLSGTPSGGTQGAYALIFTASNGVGTDAVQNFTLTVNSFLAFTSAPATTCVVGTFCTFAVTATGVPLPTISLSGGSLPSGLNYVSNGNGSGTLSGTAAVGTGGLHQLTFTASNGVEPDAVQNFALTVNQAPAITSSPGGSCAVNLTCALTITTTGFPLPTLSISGAGLPFDVSFFDNGDGTGVLSGVPDPGTEGTYALVFTAANGIGSNAGQSYTLTINASLAITSADNVACIVGVPCTFTVTTNGVPAPAISVSGAMLPSGINFADNGNGTATLAGTAGAGTAGVYGLTFTASNLAEPNAVQAFTLTVNKAPLITSALPPDGQVGVSYNHTYAATGFPAPTFSVTAGALPTSVMLSANGTVAGTPTSAGTFTGTVTASNGVAPDANQNFSVVIAPPAGTPVTLTVTVNGSGSGSVTSLPVGIACPGDCTENYISGTAVVLTATPTAGSIFTGWTGGGCNGTVATCNVTVDTTTSVSATFALSGTVVTLDVDLSAPGTKYDPLTDGLLVLRYMFGLSGTSLATGATGLTAARDATQITGYLKDIFPYLDVDGNGNVDALTDGLLIIRYLSGLTGDQLIGNAVGVGAKRMSATDIFNYLVTLTP